jgi:hypothetical protein
MGKIPIVFNMSITKNQYFWLSLAAFQRAIPFHINSHTTRIKNRYINCGLVCDDKKEVTDISAPRILFIINPLLFSLVYIVVI